MNCCINFVAHQYEVLVSRIELPCGIARKLIGAKYFLKGYEAHVGPVNTTSDYRSPRDIDGHGTHTASTSAGNFVQGKEQDQELSAAFIIAV